MLVEYIFWQSFYIILFCHLSVKDLDTLKEKYCKEIANVNLPLSKEDIENVLSKYYSERAALLQARSSDRTRLNERLQERIDNMRNATTEEERNDSDQVWNTWTPYPLHSRIPDTLTQLDNLQQTILIQRCSYSTSRLICS